MRNIKIDWFHISRSSCSVDAVVADGTVKFTSYDFLPEKSPLLTKAERKQIEQIVIAAVERRLGLQAKPEEQRNPNFCARVMAWFGGAK